MEKQHGGWVIIMTFCFGFMLVVMPLPKWAVTWRPDWIGMILIYWCIAVPQRVGIASGWLVGIIYDILTDTLLGLHALSFCVLAYIASKLHRRIRIFPWWQQASVVGILVALVHLPEVWILGMLGQPPIGWSFLHPSVTSIVLWRWLFIILRDIRRFYKVN